MIDVLYEKKYDTDVSSKNITYIKYILSLIFGISLIICGINGIIIIPTPIIIRAIFVYTSL